MANKLKSRWTVTFDKGGPNELVLCGAGMFLADVIGVGGEQVVEDADYIEADSSEPLALGNVKRPQMLTVHKAHADREAALEWCFSQDLLMPVGVRSTLTVEIEDGATYVYSPCAIARWNFALRRGGIHETEATYELKCGALSLGTPAGPDPIGLEEALASFSRTTGLLDAGDAVAADGEGVATWTNAGTADDATQATAGERPTVLRGAGLYLPGVAGNYYSVAYHVDLTPGTIISFRWSGRLESYTPAARVCLMSRWVAAGNQRSWAMYLETDGKVSLVVSTDGTAGTVTTWTSALPLGMPDGEFVGIGLFKNGTSLSFRIYPEEFPSSVGSLAFAPTQVISNLNPFDSASPLEVGSTDGGTNDLLEGYVHSVNVLGIGTGSNVAADFVGENSSLPSTVTTHRTGTAPARAMYAYGAVKGEGAYPRFDGTDDSLELATPVPLNAEAGATVIWLGTLNRTSGNNDLVYLATNASDPRILLRVDDGDVVLQVRRTDAEATATITAAAAVAQYFEGSICAVVDYAGGVARIYVDGAAVASAALTSAGVTSATDSSETRIMAGAAGANPAAGDVRHVLILEEALSPFELADYLVTLTAAS